MGQTRRRTAPKMTRLEEFMEAHAKEKGFDSGIDFVCDRYINNCWQRREFSDHAQTLMGEPISDWLFARWLKADDDRHAQWKDAVAEKWGKAASDATRVYEDTPIDEVAKYTPQQVTWINNRAHHTRKTAALHNPDWREKKEEAQVNVTLNLPALHLEALKKHGHVAPTEEPKQIEPVEADYTIEDTD